MATSGVGILALIGGTRLRKKTKGAGVSQVQVHDSTKLLQKGGGLTGHAGKMAA